MCYIFSHHFNMPFLWGPWIFKECVSVCVYEWVCGTSATLNPFSGNTYGSLGVFLEVCDPTWTQKNQQVKNELSRFLFHDGKTLFFLRILIQSYPLKNVMQFLYFIQKKLTKNKNTLPKAFWSLYWHCSCSTRTKLHTGCMPLKFWCADFWLAQFWEDYLF